MPGGGNTTVGMGYLNDRQHGGPPTMDDLLSLSQKTLDAALRDAPDLHQAVLARRRDPGFSVRANSRIDDKVDDLAPVTEAREVRLERKPAPLLNRVNGKTTPRP